MAGTVKISNLTAGTPTAAGVIPYSEGGTTLYSTLANMRTGVTGAGTTLGQILAVTASGAAGFIDSDFNFAYLIGNAGTTAITQTGMYPYFEAPYAGAFESMDMFSGTIAGNATIDIWKGNYGTPPTGTSQSICGTAKPTMTGGTTFTNGSLVSWTTTFSKGDVFAVNLNGVGTIAFLSVNLKGRKTAVS